MNPKQTHTHFIKQLAGDLGFDFCGIARAEKLNEDASRLDKWLKQGLHGNMAYMENHFDLRIDPSKLVPGARSVITVMKNYYPEQTLPGELKISKYAYGKDYHEVIRKQLKKMISRIREQTGDFYGRGFVDSAPVLERAWANRSGLGWIGKNGNLINQKAGSFYFIATLITDLDLMYDDPVAKDFCGNCRKCIDACPTDAIQENKVVNGSQCISYFTIELKEAVIPSGMDGKFNNWMFGCDICQDVCPWNRFSKPHAEKEFQLIPQLLDFSKKDWEELNEEMFQSLFRHSPLKRSKFKGIKRNIDFLLKPESRFDADPS